jgi:hypothetical protein
VVAIETCHKYMSYRAKYKYLKFENSSLVQINEAPSHDVTKYSEPKDHHPHYYYYY